jgi:ABC-type Fe3+-hydroxamate transport system substrate-binding protein
MFPPERIVCLTEETVETLYLLGEDRRIVGVSGYAVRPPQVRREKPRVSAFISADVPKIIDLKPDLVLTFSDLQAASSPGDPQKYLRACIQPARHRQHGRRRTPGRSSAQLHKPAC